MKIYTKSGDRGQTGLFSGQRVRKSDIRIAAIGDVDELNSILGMAATFDVSTETAAIIENIQAQLFDLGAGLATISTGHEQPLLADDESIRSLERLIDEHTAKIPELKNFILPGGSQCGSCLHVARSVCRRAERSVEGLTDPDRESAEHGFLRYLNRLGDFLFVLARYVNQEAGVPEKKWNA